MLNFTMMLKTLYSMKDLQHIRNYFVFKQICGAGLWDKDDILRLGLYIVTIHFQVTDSCSCNQYKLQLHLHTRHNHTNIYAHSLNQVFVLTFSRSSVTSQCPYEQALCRGTRPLTIEKAEKTHQNKQTNKQKNYLCKKISFYFK